MSWDKLQAEEYPEWAADVLALVESGQLFCTNERIERTSIKNETANMKAA